MTRKWYRNWLNSPYYHILYNQRNDKEAEFFIDNLCEYLQPQLDSRLLDIGCGRGRHATYLNKKGYDVTGIDLSYSNIKFCKQFENDRLHFYLHDMRHLLYMKYFDVAFSLFTTFGYFNTFKENLRALKSFNKSLKNDGVLVLDYINKKKITKDLVSHEIKHIENIEFHISKRVENDKIVKEIVFEHKNKEFAFKEDVAAFSLSDFEELFFESNFKVEKQFGDHSLNTFDEDKSDRVIFICRKVHA